MIQWALRHIVWFTIRVVVTLACIWTLQNVIHREGYLVPYSTLLVGAVCLIVGVRMWMPSYKENDHGSKSNLG